MIDSDNIEVFGGSGAGGPALKLLSRVDSVTDLLACRESGSLGWPCHIAIERDLDGDRPGEGKGGGKSRIPHAKNNQDPIPGSPTLGPSMGPTLLDVQTTTTKLPTRLALDVLSGLVDKPLLLLLGTTCATEIVRADE
ncbi:hypothetical protein PoB_000207000 [Plakobranchus ocellatus]|uniref:Uncharacterized protein n=1 Tax=Plakobranchus ocellatus TaxID=259542 RepID=A0AAV3XYR9_9GAST|nr:hypothetical protein PoB_000207000 [Plakobranchus ocellatus]